MKYKKINKIILIQLIVLIGYCPNIFAQFVDITYSVKTNYIKSGTELAFYNEPSNQEYTGIITSTDDVYAFLNIKPAGTTNCQTIDVPYRSIATYAQDISLQTLTNRCRSVSFSIEAWEDDRGDRCSYDSNGGVFDDDDDLYGRSLKIYKIRTSYPSADTFTLTPIYSAGNFNYFQMQTTWKYDTSGVAFQHTGNLATFSWNNSNPNVYSYLLYLSAGHPYNITTCDSSIEDADIRIYGVDGYSYPTTGIKYNTTCTKGQSNVSFTPNESGKYVIEISRYDSSTSSYRQPLLNAGSVKIQDLCPPNPIVSYNEPIYSSSDSRIITATNAGNSIVNWYLLENGISTLVQTGNSYSNLWISVPRNYLVEFIYGNCKTSKNVILYNRPTINTTSSICPGNSAILSSTNNNAGTTTNWYNSNYVFLGSGNSFTTPILSQDTTFYANVTDGEFNSNYSSINVKVIVDVPQKPIINYNNIISTYAGFGANLYSTFISGATTYWYDSNYVLLGSGKYFNTPTLTEDTIFYARNGEQCSYSGYTTINIDVLATVNIDATITKNGNVLIANASGVTYQWISACNNESSQIPNQNDQSFTPTNIGNYGVLLTDINTGYSVRSECIEITSLTLGANAPLSLEVNTKTKYAVNIYPNPTNNLLNISFIDFKENYLKIIITDSNGRVIKKITNINKKEISIDLSNESSGLYFINIYNDTINEVHKVLKK